MRVLMYVWRREEAANMEFEQEDDVVSALDLRLLLATDADHRHCLYAM